MVAARGIAPLSAACRAAVLLLDDTASMVDLAGLEPATFPVRGGCAPGCATSPYGGGCQICTDVSSLWGWRGAAPLIRVAGWAGGSRTLRRPCIRRLHSCRCATAQWWRRPGLHRYFP